MLSKSHETKDHLSYSIYSWHILYSFHTEPLPMTWYMEAETKWSLFRRRRFQIYLHEWKYMNFVLNFTKLGSYGSNQQHSSIGSYNDLTPIRQQDITWTNNGKITDAYICHSASITYIWRQFNDQLTQKWSGVLLTFWKCLARNAINNGK